jgi:hypothetical protein
LEGNASLLGLIGTACLAAASASAAPEPAVFNVTISGSATADFDHTNAPAPTGDCRSSVRSEGFRTARFHSVRPTVVRFVGGRLQTVEVGAIAGTVELTGPNTLNEICPNSEKHTSQLCAKSTRTFRNARATLVGVKAGAIAIRPFKLELRRIHCPREPDDVVASPLGPIPGPLHVSIATLTNPRTTTVTLTASASRRKNYAAPEAGTTDQRSSWKLTFKRVRP